MWLENQGQSLLTCLNGTRHINRMAELAQCQGDERRSPKASSSCCLAARHCCVAGKSVHVCGGSLQVLHVPYIRCPTGFNLLQRICLACILVVGYFSFLTTGKFMYPMFIET